MKFLLARQQAESLGASFAMLVSNYIEQWADTARRNQDVEEFIRLSLESKGDSKGWTFNRDEIHERQ